MSIEGWKPERTAQLLDFQQLLSTEAITSIGRWRNLANRSVGFRSRDLIGPIKGKNVG